MCCQLQASLEGDELRLMCSSYSLFIYLSYNEMCLYYGARQSVCSLLGRGLQEI